MSKNTGTVASDDANFEADALGMAAWFCLPGGGQPSFAKLMRTHHAWFDQARRRAMGWDDIRRYLRKVGITTNSGEAFPLSTLTAADTRYRAKFKAGNMKDLEPFDTTVRDHSSSRPSPPNKKPFKGAPAKNVTPRGRGRVGPSIGTIGVAGGPECKPSQTVGMSVKSSAFGQHEGGSVVGTKAATEPAILLAAMKRSADLRRRGVS